MSESAQYPKIESSTKPATLPFIHFQNSYQMVKVIADSVQAYSEWNKRTGRIHGDISPNTILIDTRNQGGVLADWEAPVNMTYALHTRKYFEGMSGELFLHYISFEEAPLTPALRNLVQKFRFHAHIEDIDILDAHIYEVEDLRANSS